VAVTDAKQWPGFPSQKSEVRSLKSEGRGQRPEVGGREQKAEGRRQKADAGDGSENLCFRGERKLARNQFAQVQFAAGMVDIDSGKIPLGIVVKDDPCGNLPAFDARFLREVDGANRF
jgi:hypothetical protein